MKPKKPTPAQLRVLARVRDERIAKVSFRSISEHATYSQASIRNGFAPLGSDNRICGDEVGWLIMIRCESRGWVEFDGVIARLTDAGQALLADRVSP